MAHLKKSAITGHLLKNAAGHLVIGCRTTTTTTTTTTTAATTTTTLGPPITTSTCPEDSYCENTCANSYSLVMAIGLMDCNPANEDCDGTYTMVDGTACIWTGAAPISPCDGYVFCAGGYWVAQVVSGISVEQCEWQKPAYNNSCPPGTYSYVAGASTCATCPANVTIT